MKNRRYIDSVSTPAPLAGFQPSALSLSILRIMCEHLQSPCFLVGGALRSEFMKATPKDYDVHICPKLPTNMSTGQAKRLLKEALKSIPGFEEIETDKKTSHQYESMKFSFNGAVVDIVLHRDPQTLESLALYGDATVNSIAMDASGTVKCHPLFAQHARDRVYAIRVTDPADLGRSLERFRKKSDRLGDFTLLMPSEYAKTL